MKAAMTVAKISSSDTSISSVTIATSLVPGNFDAQHKAVSSWLNLGFNVISVNSREEVEKVTKLFPDVKVFEVKRNAAEVTGKPMVLFDDVLAVLHEMGSEIVGIVNSDVHLIAGADFVEWIAAQAKNSFVFGSREDVATADDLGGNTYFLGFDCFFFDRSWIQLYPATKFCLGAPWWDYWAPILPIIKNVPVKMLISPVAFHIIHNQNWSEKIFNHFKVEFSRALREVVGGVSPSERLDDVAAMKPQFLEFYALEFIRKYSSPIVYQGALSCQNLIEVDAKLILQQRDELLFYRFWQAFFRKNAEDLNNSFILKMSRPLTRLLNTVTHKIINYDNHS